jgi:hypothetical protein
MTLACSTNRWSPSLRQLPTRRSSADVRQTDRKKPQDRRLPNRADRRAIGTSLGTSGSMRPSPDLDPGLNSTAALRCLTTVHTSEPAGDRGLARHCDQRGFPARVWTPSAFDIPDLLDQGLIDRPEVQVSYCIGTAHARPYRKRKFQYVDQFSQSRLLFRSIR